MELWEEEYKGKYTSKIPSLPTKYIPSNADDGQWGGLQRFQNTQDSDDEDYSRVDILQLYLSEPHLRGEDPFTYWGKRYQSEPDLCRFAYDMLATLNMSDECDRTFSSAKHLITDSRSRLAIDITEANEFLRA
jgi:hypothetical protein